MPVMQEAKPHSGQEAGGSRCTVQMLWHHPLLLPSLIKGEVPVTEVWRWLRKWFIILALPDAIPNYSALVVGDSPWRCKGLQHDCSGKEPIPCHSYLPGHIKGFSPRAARNEEDSYCQVKRFHIINQHISTEPWKGLVLCLSTRFWSRPTADLDRVQPMHCSQS